MDKGSKFNELKWSFPQGKFKNQLNFDKEAKEINQFLY